MNVSREIKKNDTQLDSDSFQEGANGIEQMPLSLFHKITKMQDSDHSRTVSPDLLLVLTLSVLRKKKVALAVEMLRGSNLGDDGYSWYHRLLTCQGGG